MKLQREPIEIDLYVENKELSEKEKQEIRDYVKALNLRKKLIKKKHKQKLTAA
ncbi:MAG: hypothetical protein ABI199_00200 [Bacteroidia bacterium]